MTGVFESAKVIVRAREIMRKPPGEYGYSDVGDVLVRFLRDEIDATRAMYELDNLAIDYDRDAAR